MLHVTQAKLSDDAMKWFQSEWNKGKVKKENLSGYLLKETIEETKGSFKNQIRQKF